jgi:hypothetical protein
MPVATLARTMTQNELRDWQVFAARFSLPSRRLELYLAQIALLIAVCMGGVKDAKLTDYLFDPPPTPAEQKKAMAEQKKAIDEAKQFFGFAPRKKVKRGAK